MVGAFHLQGSHWDRSRRRFATLPGPPSSLWAAICPTDVDSMPHILGRLEACGCDAASGQYAVLRNSNRSVDILNSAQVCSTGPAPPSPPPALWLLVSQVSWSYFYGCVPYTNSFCSGVYSEKCGWCVMQDPVRLCMQPGDADMLTFAPVVTLRATSRAASPRDSLVPVASAKPAGKVSFAVLGLANMLNGGGCVSSIQRDALSAEGALLLLSGHQFSCVFFYDGTRTILDSSGHEPYNADHCYYFCIYSVRQDRQDKFGTRYVC